MLNTYKSKPRRREVRLMSLLAPHAITTPMERARCSLESKAATHQEPLGLEMNFQLMDQRQFGT